MLSAEPARNGGILEPGGATILPSLSYPSLAASEIPVQGSQLPLLDGFGGLSGFG
jgi:hypothetical protein